jgi:hypothetical protein
VKRACNSTYILGGGESEKFIKRNQNKEEEEE